MTIRISMLDPARPIHFSGIAGSAMNGLAAVFHTLGFTVVGTDPNAASIEKKLTPLGIIVSATQDGSHIPEGTQLLVASAALKSDHPELVAARSRSIPIISYAQCVGSLMAERQGVAVAGTHGKTTVTAMIVSSLRRQGIDPGFVVGGYVPDIGAGAEAGSSDIFVAEACEYNRSFLNFFPKVGVITNIEADHLDVYGSFDAVKQAFVDFISNVTKSDGTLVYSRDCPHVTKLVSGLKIDTLSYSIKQSADIQAAQCKASPSFTTFELIVKGVSKGCCRLSVPGAHNISNALAAVGVGQALGLDPIRVAEALESFSGAGRRFEPRGEIGGISIVDDYAHHPTELKFLLSAARERFPGRRIVLAFQPHQYSRTAALIDDFASVMTDADIVLIPNIFFARDSKADVDNFDPDRFESRLRQDGADVTYLGSLNQLTETLAKTLRSEDVLLTAGAGDIDTIINPLTHRLKEK